MKTFAAAVIAATANADAMAVPDWIAGFMYGMTGDNNLTEIEACYQGGSQILTDSKLAFTDFEAGQYFAGIQEAGVVWNEVGSSMTTCEGMDEDIAAIEAWAKIFTQPAELSKTVAKNWVFHGRKIKKDIASEEADWSAGKYFQAGQDTADALVLAVGPIASTSAAANMPIDAPFLFLGGLLEGMVGDNHLAEVQTCVTDAEGVLTQVEGVVADMEAGHWFKAAEDVKSVITNFPTTLSACEGMDEDIAAIESWAQIFKSKTELISTVTKHMIFHKSEITGDIAAVKSEWGLDEYFKSGKSAADLITVAIGPIIEEASAAADYSVPNLDLLMLPEMAAGFVYGMVGDNHLAEFEACYSGVSPLMTYLENALKDVEAFHIFAAMKQFEEFVYHFQVDAASCTHMSEDVAAIEAWAQIFKSPATLVSTATKHYLLHKKAITADIAAIKADDAAKSYFSVGKDAADLLTILVGPIE